MNPQVLRISPSAPRFVELVDGISADEAADAIGTCARLGLLGDAPAGWVILPEGIWSRTFTTAGDASKETTTGTAEAPADVETCVVEGCDWGDDGHGNTVGKPMCGQGSWRPECRINWCSADPEDLEPYGEYLRALAANAAAEAGS